MEKWRTNVIRGAWLLFGLAAIFGHVRAPEDFGDYLNAGRAVLRGVDIYSVPFNVTPPFFSLLCVPLAWLSGVSPYLAVVVWSILNCVAVLLLCDLGLKLTYGRGLAFSSASPGVPLTDARVFLPVLFTLPYLIDNFQYHQINLLIFLLALYGLYAQQNGRALRGGIAIGAAAAIKVMPVLFLPYLVWRRRWRAAAVAMATTVAFSLSPMLLFGWRRFWSDVFAWLEIVRNTWDAAGPNQSVFAMWDRIIGHGLVPFLAPGASPLAFSGRPAVEIAWALTFVAIGLAMLLALRRAQCESDFCWAVEWCVIFLMGAVFGRVTWKHYLVVMLLPNMLLYALWRSQSVAPRIRRVTCAVLLICFALALVTGSGLVGHSLALRLETGSIATYAVLTMLGCLLWLRARPFIAGDSFVSSANTNDLRESCLSSKVHVDF